MKKIFSALLALVMLMGAVFMLASCGAKPELDLDEAAKNLEDNGYTIVYEKDTGSRAITASLHAYKDDGENEYYYLDILEYENATFAKIEYKKMKSQQDAAIEKLEYALEYYEQYLKSYEDEMDSEEIERFENYIKTTEEEIEVKKESVIGRSGKFVWYGDKEAIDASKGK